MGVVRAGRQSNGRPLGEREVALPGILEDEVRQGRSATPAAQRSWAWARLTRPPIPTSRSSTRKGQLRAGRPHQALAPSPLFGRKISMRVTRIAAATPCSRLRPSSRESSLFSKTPSSARLWETGWRSRGLLGVACTLMPSPESRPPPTLAFWVLQPAPSTTVTQDSD